MGYIRNSIHIPVGYYIASGILFGLLIWLVKGKKKIAASLLLPYMFLIFAATVLNRTSGASFEYDLMPLRFIQTGNEDLGLQFYSNIAMFIPVGLLLPVIADKWSLIIGFGFSIFLELSQLVMRRGLCEIDDVISNTLGVIIGAIVYVVISFIARTIRQIWRTGKPHTS